MRWDAVGDASGTFVKLNVSEYKYTFVKLNVSEFALGKILGNCFGHEVDAGLTGIYDRQSKTKKNLY